MESGHVRHGARLAHPLGIAVLPDGVNCSLFSESATEIYWGYGTVGFFSPHSAYAIDQHGTTRLNKFRDLVKALHRTGSE